VRLVVFIGGDDPVVARDERWHALQREEGEGSEEGPASQSGIARGWRSMTRETTAMIPRESGDGGDTRAAMTGQKVQVKVRKLAALPMRSKVVRRGVATEGAMVAIDAAFS
jgi:ribosomal protein S8E